MWKVICILPQCGRFKTMHNLLEILSGRINILKKKEMWKNIMYSSTNVEGGRLNITLTSINFGVYFPISSNWLSEPCWPYSFPIASPGRLKSFLLVDVGCFIGSFKLSVSSGKPSAGPRHWGRGLFLTTLLNLIQNQKGVQTEQPIHKQNNRMTHQKIRFIIIQFQLCTLLLNARFY